MRHFPSAAQSFDGAAQAKLHPITLDKPAVNFFQGAVLGNGGMGVVVTTRPDAIEFHFGHNNVWDIRLAEIGIDKTGTFAEIMEKVKALPEGLKDISDDKWFADYFKMLHQPYDKPYPRPFPCGTVVLGFDRGKAELLGHQIDISTGLCDVFLLIDGRRHSLQVFTDMNADALWFRLLDENGRPTPSCFNRLRVIPDSKTPSEFPRFTVKETHSALGFRQVMPYQEPDKYDREKGHPKDRVFTLEANINTGLENGVRHQVSGQDAPLRQLERYITADYKPFIGCVTLKEGLATDIADIQGISPSEATLSEASGKSVQTWAEYWSKSGVTLDDKFLEDVWYWNMYFFNCAVKEGVRCPGLFANWSFGNIGTAWHGDYHMNYNTQQPFWLPFSTNHPEKNIPYVDLVYHLLPVSEYWAKEYYGMRGAFFPHSAYPVDMNTHPYPLPNWGWEVFETPWTVQGLWWHYIYTKDDEYLRNRLYEPIKKAVLFLVDYMKRPDAHGNQWGDDRYHIFPSVPPELYSLQPGFKYNYDTQCDLTLTKFIFTAFIEATAILKLEKQEKTLLKDVKEILTKMPEYSTAQSEQYGEIYTSVPGESAKMVYNLPANLLHVFPGEEYGIDAPAEVKQKLLNTLAAHRNEGGNDIVSLNMIAVRLGALDVEKFKRQVNYALLPNKTCADYCMQSGGRYDDNTAFDWMGNMGMWFENFSLPLVINECLMQSYDGRIRLFPNWDLNRDVSFTTMRAVGAFLVSASVSGGKITNIHIFSEKGSECKLINPYGASRSVTLIRNGKPAETLSGELLTFKTAKGEEIEIKIK
jgi:hypothetical protein